MPSNAAYRSLTPEEIATLTQQGCSAADWNTVEVADPFLPDRVRSSHFAGRVRIGTLDGTVSAGVEKDCGIYGAHLIDTTVGNGCRIANIGVHVANYAIGDGVCIENVGTLQTNPEATFGNGTEVDVLNEGGGREVLLFDGLCSQVAYLMCVHRYRANLVARLQQMVRDYVETVKSDTGTIGAGAQIRSVTRMVDVRVGEGAVIDGAARLVNGTVLSAADAVTTVGADVQADDFIIAEGSRVVGGAILAHSFVGQGCQVGKQYSAENSLFFANCEAFHGEACSLFAGPYSVTHHKSTLLIAALVSFYNAGSGTNQSNHMYKLGPLHEGKLDRGSKTGSFSYMMWPCRIGPFSVVLGKHKGTFDTSQFPFAHIEATAAGKCSMIPGMNLSTVGTVRDGAKWPARDRRSGAVKRDRIVFDVFSPFTVGKMIQASKLLKELSDTTDRSVDTVHVGGAEIKRVLLRTGQKFYRAGIHNYLLEKVLDRVEAAIESGATSIEQALATNADAVHDAQWIDIGGQLMPKSRLDALNEAVDAGRIETLDAFAAELDGIFNACAADEWAWVKAAHQEVFDRDLAAAGKSDLEAVADELLTSKTKFLNLILRDAEKEFDATSRAGFGQDGAGDDADEDFRQVRGVYDDDKFVKQMRGQIEDLQSRVAQFKQKLAALA